MEDEKLLTVEEMENLNAVLKEKKKSIPRVTYDEYLNIVNNGGTVDNPYLINIRGANGAGKSSVPLLMTLVDPDIILVTNENGKEILTYSPAYQLTILGRYYTKTGGLDISVFQDKLYIKEVLENVWHDTQTNILMEGIVCSSSYGFYADLFRELEQSGHHRDILIMNLVMELDDLENRILRRNGGKPIKMHYVEGKQATVKRNIKKFEQDGFNSWVTNTRDVPFCDLLGWYDAELARHRKPTKLN